ncbi:unnamed protein product [Sphagnum jensenii]|uniref:Secreted protein n=1 Tax=Sphagnum jensenii TaxID=128206 RepID=A0ABP1BI79_9BRYO
MASPSFSSSFLCCGTVAASLHGAERLQRCSKLQAPELAAALQQAPKLRSYSSFASRSRVAVELQRGSTLRRCNVAPRCGA